MTTTCARYSACLRGANRILRLSAVLLLFSVPGGLWLPAIAGPVNTLTPGARPVPADQAIWGETKSAFTQQYGPPYIQMCAGFTALYSNVPRCEQQ
jgi:hypothetical protein